MSIIPTANSVEMVMNDQMVMNDHFDHRDPCDSEPLMNDRACHRVAKSAERL